MRHPLRLVFCSSDDQRIIQKTSELPLAVALTFFPQINHGLSWQNLPFQSQWQLQYGESNMKKREKPGPQPLAE